MDEFTEEIYKENIIDHYKNPQNKKELENATISHKEHNPLCGDEITLFLKINEGKISDVGFIGHGCAISQASISMLTEKLKGMSLEEAKKLNKEDILEMLGIQISYTRMKCALLSLKTLEKGIENA